MATEDRDAVAALARKAKGGVISLTDAAAALGTPQARAAVRLGRLARRGWIQRLRRGLYLIRPLEAAANQAAIPEDP